MSAPTTLRGLAEEVAERIGRPVDVDAVAATVETIGVREVDARERFGAPTVFVLAEWVEPIARILARPAVVAPPLPPFARAALASARFLRFYGRGVFFALPMVVQVLTIAFLRLGTRFHLSDGQATAVMLGSIASFLVTGGFVQAIGRLGSVYVGRGNHVLARRLTYRILGVGLLASVGLALVLWLVGTVVELVPQPELRVAIVYELVFSALWLFLAVLYMLQQRTLVLACVGAWVGVFAVLLAIVDTSVYVAQWGGAAAGIASSALVGAWRLHRLVRETGPERALEVLPPARQLAREVAPYFWYGVLYFTLVFADRIVGWTKATPAHYAVYFHGPYELGRDWALLTMLLTVALLDHTINAFAVGLGPTQRRFAARDLRLHNRSFQLFYLRQVVLLAVLVAISAAVLWLGGLWLRDAAGSLVEIRDFFSESVTYRVFIWAALGYGLLVWGLLNAVFFFFVSRPAYALRPLVWGIGLGVAVGIGLSRSGIYWESVIGLAVGALVFAAGTTLYAIRLLDEIDYYAYASY